MTELRDYQRMVERPHLAAKDKLIAGLAAENDRLRAVLQPFAKLADDFETLAQKAIPDADVTLAVGDGTNVAGSLVVRLGDCRKARAALSPPQQEGK